MTNQRNPTIHPLAKLNPWMLAFFISYGLIFLSYIIAAFNGFFTFSPGDPSSRIVQGMPRLLLSYSDNIPSIIEFLSPLSPWPPTPFVVQGIFMKLLYACGVSETSAMIFAIEAFSIGIIFSGIFFWALTVSKTFGWGAGFFLGLILYATPSLQHENFTLMTRFPFFTLCGLSALMLHCYWQHKRFIYLIASAVALLIGTMFRNEAIVFAFATCIFLFLYSPFRLRDSIVFGLISGSYHLSRMILVLGWYADEKINFMNFGKTYSFGANPELAHKKTWLMLDAFMSSEGAWLLPLIIILGVLWASRKLIIKEPNINEPPNKKVALPYAYWVIHAVIFSAFLAFSLWTGRIDGHYRYLMLSVCLIGIIFAIPTGYFAESLFKSTQLNARAIPLLSALLMIAISVMFVTNNLRLAKQQHPEIKEALIELSKHTPIIRDGAIFDTNLHKEISLQLYTYAMEEPLNSFVGWGAKPEINQISSTQEAHEVTLDAHRFIQEFRPKIAVLASDSQFEAIKTSWWVTTSVIPRPTSYFRPYFNQGKTPNEFNFQSPFFPNAPIVNFTPLFETTTFAAYELTYN